MIFTLTGNNYSVDISSTDDNAYIESGHFGGLALVRKPLVTVELRRLSDAHDFTVSERFGSIRAERFGELLRIFLSEPDGIQDIMFVVTAEADSLGISWKVEVINDSSDYSVMSVSYPLPDVTADSFELFVPTNSGKIVPDAGHSEYKFYGNYPGADTSMQYFAAYNSDGGVYLGVEDGRGSAKRFTASAANGIAKFSSRYWAIAMTKPHNSFQLAGRARWQYIKGDWYDASKLYTDFVRRHAEWLPSRGEVGRPDTNEKFYDIPFWLVGYIPNTPSQGRNMPMTLSIGTENQANDYWYKSAIKLRRELGVPIAMHVYNWHSIPFNIEYPHFLPPKEIFVEGLRELQANGVAVLPYINAVSWETLDGEMGHDVNFENTGRHGAVIDQYGKLCTAEYPQTTVKGTKSLLAPICPTFERWHEIVAETARRLTVEYGVDGIYFDEISAHAAHCCCNPEHTHLPGGGSYWSEGYRLMMSKVRANMARGSFSFSECNTEAYMDAFDGQLTWTWVNNHEVPAFPAVYSGYTQMIGRFNLGAKRDDFEYFKYTTAKSLMYAQQLGWITASILEQPGWTEFLKKTVTLRYELRDKFRSSDMLRPLRVRSDIADVTTSTSGLWSDREPITMEQVFGGAWRCRDGSMTTILLANIAEVEAGYTYSFNAREYGLDTEKLHNRAVSDSAVSGFADDEYEVDGDNIVVRGRLAPHEFKYWEIQS